MFPRESTGVVLIPCRFVEHCIFVCVQTFRPHCSGCPFPSPHLKALGSATQGHARDPNSRATLGNPQDKRHIWQIYSGRSAKVATRPESQAAQPHTSIFRDDCHLPAMIRLTGGCARCRRVCCFVVSFVLRSGFRRLLCCLS